MESIHKLGQYFTTNTILKNKVLEFILNKPEIVLEPSVGQGDLIQVVHNNNSTIKFDMYEIDDKIKLLDNIPKNVIYSDFLTTKIDKKYITIIGNPPFVRTTKGNLYIDFIQKCYSLLCDKGELIFIIPSDFFKLTSASNLLNNMLNHGTFTHIYHPNDEKLFDNASIDVLVFRYCKTETLKKEILYNNVLNYIINNDGLVTFSKTKKSGLYSFKDYFNIYVGLVTGRENVYKNEELGNITLLNSMDKVDKYIFIQEFPSKDESINNYLLKYKHDLINRKIRKFGEKNWFEWGAPRNMKTIESNFGKECIYIHNLTRHSTVAFKSKVQYFGGGLIILIPKDKIDLNNIVNYLNSPEFKNNFMFSGRFKIGHRQISNSYLLSSIKV